MKDLILAEGHVPPIVAAEFMYELKKEATPAAPKTHPMDMAVGALIGGTMGAYKGSIRHKTMPSGETPYSNKLRHEMEHHLETRLGSKKPSFSDRMSEKMIAGKLRYARLMQENPNIAPLVEGAVGAATGAVIGGRAGKSIRSTTWFNTLSKSGAAKVADVIGVSRSLVEKKANHLGIPYEGAVELELAAFGLSSKDMRSSSEMDYLSKMAFVQDVVSPKPPEPIQDMKMSPATAAALPNNSMGMALMANELKKQKKI